LPQIELEEKYKAMKKKVKKISHEFNVKNLNNKRIQKTIENRHYKEKYEELMRKRILEKSAKNGTQFQIYL
jgi:hypothetical protein